MNTPTLTHQQLVDTITQLPPESLPELANFLAYLQFKAGLSTPPEPDLDQPKSGSTFLLSIAGLGEAEEDDLSERVEEILLNEIDPIRGWSFKR